MQKLCLYKSLVPHTFLIQPTMSFYPPFITTLLLMLGLIQISIVECRRYVSDGSDVTYPAINCRKHTAFLTDFGGKGDGTTSNTAVFQAAVQNLSQFEKDGGAQLIVPPGKWLTGSFNLTSHFTLFIQLGAVVLASQVSHTRALMLLEYI